MSFSDKQQLNTDLQADVAFEVLNLFNSGLLIIEENRETVFINDAARRIIRDSEFLDWRNRRLRCLSKRMENWLMTHARSFQPEQSVFKIMDRGRHLQLVIRALSNSQQTSRSPLLAVFISHLRGSVKHIVNNLIALYSLTRRESEVAGRMVQGEDAKGIARALGVKQSTVRTYIKRIYLKTGVSRQVDFLRLSIALDIRELSSR